MFKNTYKVGAFALSLSLAAFLTACTSKSDNSQFGINDSAEITSKKITKTVTLDQGWNWDMQQKFWYTTQGSQFMPYDWFLNLEQMHSTKLFTDPSYFKRYNYILQKPTPMNPDGLPIGFVKNSSGKMGEQNWVGLTCAACHTGQVNYKGTSMIVDGAPTLGDFQTLFEDLEKTLAKTAHDSKKFERFAIAVLKSNYNENTKKDLHNRVLEVLKAIKDRNELNKTKNPYGYARVDAFGEIFNMVTVHDLGIPENKAEPDAPVSYPFLWDTPQSDLVQWNGLLSNNGMGPLGRNVGEVLGVFGDLEFKVGQGYPSSANIVNLGKLERWVADLWSPKWPSEYLGEIDQTKAKAGEAHYTKNCVSCHSTINRTDPKRRIYVTMTPLKDIGTDPVMATNAGRKGKTGILEGTKIDVIAGEKLPAVTYKAFILQNAVTGAILRHPKEDVIALATSYLKIKKTDFNPIATPSYKARPLNGIWATAPYLHNGSVPNLWELLKPANERVKKFYVGNKEFDTKRVGFKTNKTKHSSLFDTSLYSNKNSGHEYGTKLSDKEKKELIEYLKTL